MRRSISFTSLIVALVAIPSLALAQWTAAPSNPPSSNATAPLNVGSSAQSKVAGLLLNTGGATNGLIVQYGRVGIDTTAPSYPLDVSGYANASGYCIGGASCITSWPSGGSGTITGVTAGTDLSGGGTSGTVTLNDTSTLNSVTSRGSSTSNSISTGPITASYITTTSGGVNANSYTVTAGKFCLGASCITSWPSGSSATPTLDQVLAAGGTSSRPATVGNLNAAVTSLGATTVSGLVSNGNINASGYSVQANSFVYSSDRNLKTNIVNLDDNDSLSNILKLQGVSFNWKNDGRPDIGLIAQDVEKVYPVLVHTNPQTGLKAVEYANLIGPLIEAIKAQQAEIDTLKAQVQALEQR